MVEMHRQCTKVKVVLITSLASKRKKVLPRNCTS
jgi:hypothetical protein